MNKSNINIDKQGWIMMKFKESMLYKKDIISCLVVITTIMAYNNKTDSFKRYY